MATSTQDMVRPGECIDLYYYDGETHQKQCFPTTQNTKYIQAFQNTSGGSQVFTIPPQMGIQDVVLEMVFPAINGSTTGLGLPRGWGYALIKQVSFRYGGSSQYFLTGDQILQNALRRQPSRSTANDLFTLGGNFAASTTLATAQTALVVLTLPHNIPSGVGKSHPLPSDLLTQQIQVTVELYPVQQVWTTSAGGASPPANLASGQFQVQQVILNNQGDALARRVDMANNAYTFPAEFVQQKQVISLTTGAGASSNAQSVVLTGFRSGEVKSIQCWLTSSADTTPNYSASGTPAADTFAPFNWYLPANIQMSYAGDIYARYDYGSSPLWNLINGNKAPAVDNAQITLGTPPTAASSSLSYWVELPFAQTMMDEDAHATLVHGKPITNGIVNLLLTVPTDYPPVSGSGSVDTSATWQLNVSYVYNTSILFSQGTADYVF